MSKYLIALSMTLESTQRIIQIRNMLSRGYFRKPSMEPHISLCPPFCGVDEDKLKEVVGRVFKEAGPYVGLEGVCTGDIALFGKELLVFPVCGVPWCLSAFITDLQRTVWSELGISEGDYDRENTLHITLLKGLTTASSEDRETLLRSYVELPPISLMGVTIYRKSSEEGSRWKEVGSFEFPSEKHN